MKMTKTNFNRAVSYETKKLSEGKISIKDYYHTVGKLHEEYKR